MVTHRLVCFLIHQVYLSDLQEKRRRVGDQDQPQIQVFQDLFYREERVSGALFEVIEAIEVADLREEMVEDQEDLSVTIHQVLLLLSLIIPSEGVVRNSEGLIAEDSLISAGKVPGEARGEK